MSEAERSFFVGAVLNPPKPGPILTFSQTVSACNRCRKRKAKCDTRLPACLPCQNSGSKCEYTEARTKTTFPRDYICDLEIEAGNLEHKLRQLQSAAKSTRSHDNNTSPRDLDTPTSSSRGNDEAQAQADLIRLESGGDAHYLGVSSGIHLARSVLESARRNNPSFDALPERRRPGSTTSPSQQNEHAATSSSRAAFPSCEAAINLVEIFFNQYQVQYPILVEDQFIQETQIFYSTGCLSGTSHNDITMRFMLQVIFAIALLSLSKENPEALVLAESFNTNAMAELTAVMQHKGPRTLQCLLLLLLYSLLNSSTAPIWYISGIAIRMVIDLGFQSERTIHLSGTGIANEDEIDLKRRLFWATYSFDRTLSIILGRPFTLEDREIDVEYPGRSLPLNKRASIIHWIKLQRLQSRSVSYLYTVKPGHEHTVEHQQSVSAWIRDMAKSLATWKDEATALADTTIHTVDWWHYWYQNALLVLHRPSPNNPTLDPEAFSTCYTAAKNMIQSSFIRVHKGLMDFSWVDLHYQFMGGITLLFLIWNSPDIRQQARSDWTSFKSCLVQWEVVLEGMVVRWDRVNRAKEVLGKLADATVDIVERDMTKSSNLRGSREASRLTQDRDHRKSIMQQLGSPRLQNAAPAQVAQPVETEITAIDMMASMPQAAAPSDTADQSQAFFNPSATQGPSFEPSPGEILEMDQTSDSPFWALETSPFALPPDLSAMFNDEMWTSFGPYENTMMPGNFGRFEYFPVPVPGADVNFGAPVTGDNGTRNAAWADSVLNFHGPWDDGGQDT